GHWNDPDMLEVGNEALTEAESRAHFSLWCLMAAPLMAGNDLRSMDETTREILTNKEVIAVNQDPLGKQGKLRVTYDGGDLEVYRKILEDGQAYLFFNRSDEPYELDLTWAMLEVEENYRIRDLWKHEDLSTTLKKPAIKYVIEPHGVKMFRLVEVKE
ncbi:MAG: glycoside hydrolase family 27 protein, partial [Bacteroidota bacterium]